MFGSGDKERFVCLACGGWVEFARGQLSRATEEWHLVGSPEALERDRLAAEINPFMARHSAHGKDPGEVIRIVRRHQIRFWTVDPARREVSTPSPANESRCGRPRY